MLKADDLLGGAEESFGSRNKRKKQEEEGGGFRAVGGFDQDEEVATFSISFVGLGMKCYAFL